MAQHSDEHYSQTPTEIQQQGTAIFPSVVLNNNNTESMCVQPLFDPDFFWQEQLQQVHQTSSDFKTHALPLARIKKVMKADPEVKAPILFAKGCEMFITEITKRAWVHAEENKRRTLQRSDIPIAISKTDMCDFLIDIVPREEVKTTPTVSYLQHVYKTYYDPNVASTQQTINPSVTYYPELTPEQMQHYQYQLQQFAANQPSSETNDTNKKDTASNSSENKDDAK
ncbi:hypothetical protein G6F56_006509 [Rhizopus delemar]|nr:hypothetical protein G6F56_006509 [Rhizopus delemar]